MMLVEQSAVPSAVWPVAEFREHLRLGTGFSDDGLQDALLERLLRSSAAVIERRTGKAMFLRSFRQTVLAWHGFRQQSLLIAPVASITGFRVVDAEGGIAAVPPTSYALVVDGQSPALCMRGASLPTIPVAGRAEIDFDAGFGAAWQDMPADLAQAVFMLAAHYHEMRHAVADTEAPVPYGVEALIAPHKPVRLFGGRR